MTPYRERQLADHYFGTIATTVTEPGPEPTTEPEPEPTPEPTPEPDDDGDGVRATRKALELAAEHGLDVANIAGTGHAGRVTVPDVQAAIDASQA